MSKPIQMWAIRDPSGFIYAGSLHDTARKARAWATKSYALAGPARYWRYWYNRGYRAVKVEVKEIET